MVQKKISIKAGGEWNSNCAEDRAKDVWELNPIYAENMVKDGGEWNPILAHRNTDCVEQNPVYGEDRVKDVGQWFVVKDGFEIYAQTWLKIVIGMETHQWKNRVKDGGEWNLFYTCQSWCGEWNLIYAENKAQDSKDSGLEVQSMQKTGLKWGGGGDGIWI